jgi:hypothetical protein
VNRRVRALEHALRQLPRTLARPLVGGLYRVLDTSLTPALHRVRACRHGPVAGQAAFVWCRSKTTRIYGSKVAVAVTPAGVITSLGLAPAAAGERWVGEALIAADRFGCYLAGQGFAGAAWQRRRLAVYGARVLSAPQRQSKRAYAEPGCPWAAGKRQVVEHVFQQPEDFFALEQHRAKTPSGLLARLAAKAAALPAAQRLNVQHARPLRHFAHLPV